MAVQVGQTLDKYELLERVGQGGMAIVYRGHDNSLRREVAVKVLHQHLAEHAEARERFEREAHAVAKLRHENILEIYDFSGTESDESYIVTEFIAGQSLKEFITDHTIRYPEIGAMIALQVCKALQHAHANGILHRDVKPENVMIRDDGLVKLTDFGIAQMIDLQRLTVTGQLLGSPAYMSPEHVNGGQLDFRTDVFAIGIVLYQLITAELPFKGKNPHEILKRIAEGDYLDPSVVNPHVGKELRRIVRVAMARDKEDRFADVSMMLAALESFLAGSGLTSPKEELGRFFDAPVAYEMALKTRLVEHLTRTGKVMLETQQPAALEAFNRVLTLQPDNTDVLSILDQLGTRQKRLRVALVGIGVLVAIGLGWGTKTMLAKNREPLLADVTVPAQNPAPPDAPATLVATSDATPTSAVQDAAVPDAPVRVRADASRTTTVVLPQRDAEPVETDAGEGPQDLGPRSVSLSVYPWVNSEFRVAGGGWSTLGGATRIIVVPAGTVKIEARNPTCCQVSAVTVPASATDGRKFQIRLPFLPATLTATCDVPGVAVKIDNRMGSLGQAYPIAVDGNSVSGTKVTVTFFSLDSENNNFYKKRVVTVAAKQARTVTCR